MTQLLEVQTDRVAAWRKRGWCVVFELNTGREQAEYVSCEVYEQVNREPLPRGLGYVCGYGATPEDAEEDAQNRLDYAEPDDEEL